MWKTINVESAHILQECEMLLKNEITYCHKWTFHRFHHRG